MLSVRPVCSFVKFVFVFFSIHMCNFEVTRVNHFTATGKQIIATYQKALSLAQMEILLWFYSGEKSEHQYQNWEPEATSRGYSET